MGLADDFKRRIYQSLGLQVDSGFDPNHVSPAPAWGSRWVTGETFPSDTPAPRPAWERYHPAPVTTDQILNVRPGGLQRSGMLMTPMPGAAPPSGLISNALPGVGTAATAIADPWGAPTLPQLPALQASLTPNVTSNPQTAMNLDAAMGKLPSPALVDQLPTGLGATPHTARAQAYLDGQAPVAANPAAANDAIARASSSRSAQAAAGMKRNALDSALGMADLGVGGMAKGGLHKLGAFARANGMPGLGGALFKTGTAAAVAAPALAYGAALLPVATGAYEGYQQAGGGGAAIQGGTAAAGALTGAAIGSALLPGVGTLIGAGIGAMGGSGLGGVLTKGAVGAVDAAAGGDTGVVGMIGRALDPIIDSSYEKEQKELIRMENSPIMQKIRDQEELRKQEARTAQVESLLLQSYLR